MSQDNFIIHKHVLPCQHIRQYPHATSQSQDDILHIAINQYVPRNNLHPKEGDVTIIATTANGVGKELYEPLWDDSLAHMGNDRPRLRAIWVADVATQGESFVLNEAKIGNDPSWSDHARDLLSMVNHFRSQMPRPMIGIGHSMGGHNIVDLSLIHPRLFTSIILLDPVLQRLASARGNFMPAYASTLRRDIWPSREAAAKSFRSKAFYKRWDPRALDLWIKHGLRELPTALYPEAPPENCKGQSSASDGSKSSQPSSTSAKPVTLTTTKHQEVLTFLRSNHPAPGESLDAYQPSRRTHPDVPSSILHTAKPFYRAEPILTFAHLPFLRPRCLYMFADQSDLSTEQMVNDRLQATGCGVGGNGGVAQGNVKSVMMEKAGHFFPLEKPDQTAKHFVSWLREDLEIWSRNEEEDAREWANVDNRHRAQMTRERIWWMKENKEEFARRLEDATRKAKL